jgi:GNAT superfamily N-acetyltransferase
MRVLQGSDVLDVADHLAEVYREVFAGEPWNEGTDDVAAFRRRLTEDVGEPDFRAVVAGDGFATAWRTRLPLPDSRAYPRVVAHLGEERVRSLLDGALVVHELAVRPGAQGAGLGRRLLAALVGTDRAWLLTSTRAASAVAFHRHLGWHELGPMSGVDSTLVVFVTPP